MRVYSQYNGNEHLRATSLSPNLQTENKPTTQLPRSTEAALPLERAGPGKKWPLVRTKVLCSAPEGRAEAGQFSQRSLRDLALLHPLI